MRARLLGRAVPLALLGLAALAASASNGRIVYLRGPEAILPTSASSASFSSSTSATSSTFPLNPISLGARYGAGAGTGAPAPEAPSSWLLSARGPRAAERFTSGRKGRVKAQFREPSPSGSHPSRCQAQCWTFCLGSAGSSM